MPTSHWGRTFHMITAPILFDWVVAYKGSNECKFMNIEMKKKQQRKLPTYNWDKAYYALKATLRREISAS